jgi:hypothetical protein
VEAPKIAIVPDEGIRAGEKNAGIFSYSLRSQTFGLMCSQTKGSLWLIFYVFHWFLENR